MSSERRVNLFTASVKTLHGTKWGYINSRGRFKILPQFEYAKDFQNNGLAIVTLNNVDGIINSLRRYVVRPKYENIMDFSEGLAVVIDKSGFKVIDETGREITCKSYSFISNFSNGRAYFALSDAHGNYLYGYLDREGKEVIPAKYLNASDFKDGKAVVHVKENVYALIDLNGNIIQYYNYPYVGGLGDGLLEFKETSDGKSGYIDVDGNVVIKPQFTSGGVFAEARAVVNIGEDIINKYGLIDKNGNFIIKPEYNSINQLGENRVAVLKAINEEKPYLGLKYAIADTEGRFLTDFIYFDVGCYKNSLASATDDRNTFFIDKTGKIVTELPVLSGGGSLTIQGDLIKAFVDYRISYYNKASELVWKQNTVIPLNYDYRVKEEKFRPDRNYIVYYAQVQGMKDKAAQQKVNIELEKLSKVKEYKLTFETETSYTGDFNIEFFQKQLLVIELNAYEFPFGAAHGMPSKIYPHIDLVTGRFYELKDLFKPGSNYVKVLSDIIGEMIKTDPEYEYVFPDAYKGIKPDQPFYIGKDVLYIYFFPYEIAPYSAGFPTFKIPYKNIMSIINTNGEFWKAFN
ncbi:WG repeat-containing protein [Clostridium sp. SYSU_GA19001]|uniref:WG repeat-containing protein n=1 Tax=Clostridium caldaquaticum TaxID=2940653 RepID=UPI0020774206|nr:WG repeat-containing protein [Clostridium caldaquaticum]MCM8712093.1 WG repeat-containing protein [Clostridium caldaquaticum]